jgi:hypothetical protein
VNENRTLQESTSQVITVCTRMTGTLQKDGKRWFLVDREGERHYFLPEDVTGVTNRIEETR